MKMSEFERGEIRRLDALKSLGCHLGMYGTVRRPAPDTEENRNLTFGVFARYLSSDATMVNRRACALMLDYLLPEWRGFLSNQTVLHVMKRSDPEVRTWRQMVLERDDNKCVKCGSEDELHAHHIVHWADAPEERVNVENGETLCKECHALEHEDIANFILS